MNTVKSDGGAWVTIRLDNRARIPLGELPAEVRAALEAAHTYENPARHALARLARGATGKKKHAFTFALRKEPEQVVTWAIGAATHTGEGEAFTVPRGALAKVREVLTVHGLGWRYEDARALGDPRMAPRKMVHRPDPRAADGGALRWYQEEAVEACVSRQNCLLRAPTGSGKSTTLIACIARLALPTLIVVDSAELLRQWHDRLVAELGLTADEIGQIGGGVKTIRPITIGMRQSLMKSAHGLARSFGVVVVDEVHRAAAATFMDVVDAFGAKFRIGASADETRKDRKEFLVYDVFGDVAHEVAQHELIEAGAVLDVECRVIPTEFRADWYVAQREAGESPDFNRLIDEMTADADRNRILVGTALALADSGEQVLVLTHRVEHARVLANGLRSAGRRADLMLGGAEQAEGRAAAIDAMRAGTLRVACGTVQAMGTAIDLPSVGRGVLATPIGNNRQLYGQIRGRLCRPGEGKTAAIVVLWDRQVSGSATLKRMCEWNRSVLVHDGGDGWIEGRAYLKNWKG